MSFIFTSKLKDCFALRHISTQAVIECLRPLLQEAYGSVEDRELERILVTGCAPRHWGHFSYDVRLQEVSWTVKDKLVSDDYERLISETVERLTLICEPHSVRASWNKRPRHISEGTKPVAVDGCKFLVRWSKDVFPDESGSVSPHAAARAALQTIRDRGSHAHVFEVIDPAGHVTTVDLDEADEHCDSAEVVGMRG